MGYRTNMTASARRHLEAADNLLPGVRSDIAGYLFGIAAECAIKAMMLDCGLRPKENGSRRGDPFFAHFPELRTMLRDTLRSRSAGTLARFIQDDRFMSHWSTDMRYCAASDVKKTWVTSWSRQARDAVGAMGT